MRNRLIGVFLTFVDVSILAMSLATLYAQGKSRSSLMNSSLSRVGQRRWARLKGLLEKSPMPYCYPPDPNTRKPSFTLPANSCDTHFHIFGPPEKFPFLPTHE